MLSWRNPHICVVLLLGFIIRLALMVYGRWQDSKMVVKYTDIDYHVFTDAAEFITKGESPYKRDTYRYTPLLAWVLTPNITWFAEFGKVLFIVCDILCGFLLYLILRRRLCNETVATMCAAFWLLNPLPATVSSRGNAESILALFVLVTIYLVMQGNLISLCLAGLVYGSSVHMKIYPVTYCVPLYLMLNSQYSGSAKGPTVMGFEIWPNKNRIMFVLCSAVAFVGLTLQCYYWYGQVFIDEAYLYHITRSDVKHNFSIYFYLMYMFNESQYSWIIGVLAFIPQAVFLITSSIYYYQDLPFCCFLNTFIFVTFNKVCTSQYFLWYLSLLPLVIPSIRLNIMEAVVMLVLWFAGQAIWLTPAYYYEFEGRNTLLEIWLASILFFMINNGILWRIITRYKHTPLFFEGKLVNINYNGLSPFLFWWSQDLTRRPLHSPEKKVQ